MTGVTAALAAYLLIAPLTTALSPFRSAIALGVKEERSFTVENNRFVKDGKPIQIISGSIHYHRIHPVYWKDRLLRVKALGLNTVQLYVPWNFHEPYPGVYDFEGMADLEGFLDITEELDLDVIIRPGPYICAEWDFGGYPWWLASDQVEGGRTMGLRTSDPIYLKQVDKWFAVLLPKLKARLHVEGGNILMVQIENEWGSCFYHDAPYLEHLVGLNRLYLGPDATLFTTDGPYAVTFGSLYGDDLVSIVDFGPGFSVDFAFTAQSVMNPLGKSPPFCSEYYTGWLTHWGEVMANTTAQLVVQTLEQILDYANGTGSVNFYMAAGGTNFGYWAGANTVGTAYQPDLTSYDYDCPVSEAGDYGQPGIGGPNKFELIRAAVASRTGNKLPEAPKPPPVGAYGTVTLNETVLLLDSLDSLVPHGGIEVTSPDIMENYNQSGGLILYRTTVPAYVLDGGAVLDTHEPVRDYATVLVDGVVAGALARSSSHTLRLAPPAPRGSGLERGEGVSHATLDILVQALGRVNFGCQWDFKGLTHPNVTLNSKTLTNWTVYPLQLDNLDKLTYDKERRQAASSKPSLPAVATHGPAFYRGTFSLDSALTGLNHVGSIPDTYVRVTNWNKGLLWVNGVNLGWFWPSAGPQNTQYLPGPYLKEGENEVIMLEMEASPTTPEVELVDKADFYGRTKPFWGGTEGARQAPGGMQALPDFSRAKYLPDRQRLAYEAAVASMPLPQ